MRLSFRTRLTLRWTLASGLLLALACLAIYAGIRTFLERNLDADLRTLAATELASAADEPGGVHLHEFPIDPRDAAAYAGKFVQILGEQGQILMQSPGLNVRTPLVEGQRLVDATAGRAPLFPVLVQGRPGRLIALVTAPPSRTIIAVGVFTDRLEATLAYLRWLLAGIWLVCLALTGTIGFSLASRALDPIRRITHRAATIAAGQFSARLDPPRLDDEIGAMTRLLNTMLERLHGAIEANRRFAADASHELRSPLTAMLGELDVTLKRERTPEEYREQLSLLRDRLREMGDLTGDLMLLVRAQEGKVGAIVEIDLAALLDRVARRARAAGAARGIGVTVQVAPGLVTYGEEALVERVFDNLARNAVLYNRNDGRVTLKAEVAEEAPASSDPDHGVVITVSDEGSGIPEEARERIFERFYRLDVSRSRQTGGTGLGLAISREIVHLHKGTIRVRPTEDPGTTIEVRLPGGIAGDTSYGRPARGTAVAS